MLARFGYEILQHLGAQRHGGARTRERIEQTAQAYGLEQVVYGVQFKCLDGISIIGGGENDDRRLGQFIQMLR